jgi:hypothetical protein
MRTKTLLLTAALGAAGVATSMAQVYSVNAVGYVTTPLVPGFNLVSNPLRNTEPNGNQVQNLFNSLPGGTSVYLWNGAGFDIATKDPDFGWEPANFASREVLPGGGVFVRLPAGVTGQSVTFVGEVVQGNNLTVNIPVGFSIVSSIVPQEGTATQLGYTPAAGDALYFWSESAQTYNPISGYDADFQEFNPPLPTVGVGEAFFARATTAHTWTRNFNVNQ